MIELFNELASILIKITGAGIVLMISTIIVPWVRNDLIPWLKEKRLYEIVQSFVLAAEKLAETGAIDSDLKKKYVIDCLKDKGITITDEIDALIECAVEELDLAIESGFIMIGDAFDDIEIETMLEEDFDDEWDDEDEAAAE